MRRLRLAAIYGVLIGTACASGRAGSDQSRTNRVIITRAQIDSVNLNTAYDIVQRFRSDMLYGRSRTSGSNAATQIPAVYVDGTIRGYVDVLRTIPAFDVEQIRFLGSRDALTELGPTATHAGVILVTQRKR